jgi:hypothetical protein
VKFSFDIFAKTVPAICIVSGVALLVVKQGGWGAVLILAGIGLQVLYLFLRYRG